MARRPRYEFGFSPLQAHAIRFADRPGKTFCGVGSVRSGKTHSFAEGLTKYTLSLKRGYKHLVGAQTPTLLREEILPHMERIGIQRGRRPDFNQSKGILKLGNQQYHFIVGNNIESIKRVRGPTFHSGLLDECTLLPDDFFKTAYGRFSFAESKIWLSMNPEGPQHPLKVEYIDEGKFDEVHTFLFDDNPSLDEAYKADLKSMYKGVYYERYVMGRWAVASGAIFPIYKVYDGDVMQEECLEIRAATDPAQSSVYCTLWFMRLPGQDQWMVVDEYYHDNTDMGPRNNREHAEAVKAHNETLYTRSPIPKGWMPRSLDWDWEDVDAGRELQKAGFKVQRAIKDNKIEVSIPSARAHLENGNIVVHPRCKGLLKELSGWVWDEKAQEKGIDQPKADMPNHAIDCLLYFTRRFLPYEHKKALFTPHVGAIGKAA